MLTKTARILVPSNYHHVDDADFLNDDAIHRVIRGHLQRKAEDVPSTNWKPMLAGGALGAFGFPALAASGISSGRGALGAAAVGAAVGAGIGKLTREADVHTIADAKEKLKSFDDNTAGYRDKMLAKAKGSAVERRQISALAANDKHREIHNRAFGTQMLR